MMQKTIYDVFESVAQRTSILSGIDLNYLYGDIKEVAMQIEGMKKHPKTAAKRFPLLWRMLPIKGKKSNDNQDVDFDCSITLIIAQYAQTSLTTPERIKSTYEPTLYPLFDSLQQALLDNTDLHFEKGVVEPFDYSDEPFWYRDREPFADFIDAILIQNLNLKIKRTLCYGDNSK